MSRANSSRRNRPESDDRPEIAMTPMIDVVFQLLIFFLMTFKPIVFEGQFTINMAPAGSAVPTESLTLPPLVVQLAADDEGNLAGIALGNTALPSFDHLRRDVAMLVSGGLAEEVEAEIRADARLKYEHIVGAVNALTRAGVTKVNFGPAFTPSAGSQQ